MTLKYYKSLAKNNFGIGNLPWKVYLTPLCHQNPSLSDSKRERQINSLKFPLANTFVSSPFKFTQSNTNVCITWHRFRSWPPSVAFLFDKKKTNNKTKKWDKNSYHPFKTTRVRLCHLRVGDFRYTSAETMIKQIGIKRKKVSNITVQLTES